MTAFTFMRFPGREVIFAIVISMLVVPILVAFVAMLELFKQFDLVGTFAAVWLLHTGFGMPLAVYIIRNYMGTMPASVIESAKVDGASHFTTFWRLVLPMSVPVLASFAIFQFLWVWNDLLIALIFLGQTNEVVTVNMAQLLGRLGEGWQLLTGRLYHDDAAAGRVLLAAAVLRPGTYRRVGQGLTQVRVATGWRSFGCGPPGRRLLRFPPPIGLG